MASEHEIYITGVGNTPLEQSTKDVTRQQVSAATKALLDAGITYDDVTRGVATNTSGASSFDVFDKGAIDIDQVKEGSELMTAFKLVKNHGQCVLVIASEESTAFAFVLAPDTFLWRRPYLKDSAIRIDMKNAKESFSGQQVRKGLNDICVAVWKLRGWLRNQDDAAEEGHVYCQVASGEHFDLSRADGKSIPEWKDVEHRQDGKHRVGYNPAKTTRDISLEDFEAVRAAGKHQETKDDRKWFKRKGGDRAALAKL